MLFESKKLFFLIAILCFSEVKTQENNFYDDKSYFMPSVGIMFIHPLVNGPPTEIKRAFSVDPSIYLSWFKFKNSWGWHLKVGGGVQGFAFKRKDSTGVYTRENSYSSGDGNYSINICRSYNFNISKKINVVSVLGPILFLNRHTDPNDISTIANSTIFAHNTKPLGFGFLVGTNTVFKINNVLNFVISTSYQRGFVKFREVIFTNSGGKSQTFFNYYGSGPSVFVGFLFHIKTSEKKVKSVEENKS